MFAELCGKEVGCGARKDASMHLLPFYTGEQRSAHEVLEEQLERTRRGAANLELRTMNEQADQGLEVLASDRPLSEFG